jgi:hypothetical protein
MITQKRFKFDFGSERAAKGFASLKKSEKGVSNVSVKGSVVYWTEETTD